MASRSSPEADASGSPAADEVDLLRRLVEIESLSDQEGPAVAELCRQMERRGFRAEVDEAGSAVGTIGRGDRRVVLLGHIDTVPGRIPIRIADGVLHGRGAVDAKGPLCAFVAAAAAAADRANLVITVVGAVGEERLGSPGATAVARWPAPDFCVIGEPSGWDAVCLGYRGTVGVRYRLRRPSRHSAGPGESVAEQAFAFWGALVAEVGRRNEGAGARGGFQSITPTIRAMGSTGDGLHDEAMLAIGLRLPPGAEIDGLLATLGDLAGEADLTIEGVQPGYREGKRSPLVPPFLRAIRGSGGTPRFSVKLGTSDVTIVGPAWRCPIVTYGPGDASLDHTPEERIELAEYGRAIRVLTDVLVAL